MTTAEAIDAIPGIVEKAIPLKPYDEIKCPAKREIALTNAKWRREQLTMRIKELIIRHEPAGIGIDLSQFDFSKLKEDE